MFNISPIKLFMMKFEKYFIFITSIVLYLECVDLSCPTGKPVRNVTECTTFSTRNELCCLLKPPQEKGDSLCYSFNSTIPTTQKWGVMTYIVDCGTNSSITPVSPISPSSAPTNPPSSTPDSLPSFILPSESSLYGVGLSNCGKQNPQTPSDCLVESTSSQSCCFYDYNGTKGCCWVGLKGNNQILVSSAFPLQCRGATLESYIVNLAFILIVFILD